MMLAADFKENGLLHFKPYATTGELTGKDQIIWSNGTVYTRIKNQVSHHSPNRTCEPASSRTICCVALSCVLSRGELSARVTAIVVLSSVG